MALTDVPYKPGVVKDDPAYAAEGYATDTQWIRWVRGKAQSLGGYTAAVNDGSTFSGIARGLFSWADTAGNIYAAIGTSTKLQVFADGTLYNITPERCNGVLTGSGPIATSTGSGNVTITCTNHQAATGDTVVIRGDTTFNNVRLSGGSGSFSSNPFYVLAGTNRVLCTLSSHSMSSGDEIVISGATAINGVTLSGIYMTSVTDASNFYVYHNARPTATGQGGGTPTYSIGKPYVVTAVPSADTFQVLSRTNANATGSGGGFNIAYRFELKSGLNNSQGAGGGFGSGDYGSGLFGLNSVAAPDTINTRIWALDNNGSQLIATPLGGAIYTWTQNWSQRAARMDTGPQRNAYTVFTNERFIMACGTTQLGALTSFSNAAPIATTSGSPIVNVTVPADGWVAGDEIAIQGLTAVGGVNVINNYYVTAALGPTTIQIAMSGPANVTGSGGGSSGFYRRNTYAPMRFRNSDGGLNGDITQWVPSATNLAGGFTATIGSIMVGLKKSRSGIFGWSDYAMYFLRYTGQQDNPYTIDMLGQGCGLAGPNAAIEQDGTAYWITSSFLPYIYNGGSPRPLPSPVKKFFAGNLATDQNYKIYGVYDSLYPALIWYYPSVSATATAYENDSYIRLDLPEASADGNAGWSVGTAAVTAALDRGLIDFPLTTNGSGTLFYMENSDAANGATLSRYVTWGPIDIGDGDKVMNVRRWVVNANQSGTLNLTMGLSRWPDGPVTAKGPYAIPPTTEKTDVRAQGRQMTATIQSNNYFRLGKSRIDITGGGYR